MSVVVSVIAGFFLLTAITWPAGRMDSHHLGRHYLRALRAAHGGPVTATNCNYTIIVVLVVLVVLGGAWRGVAGRGYGGSSAPASGSPAPTRHPPLRINRGAVTAWRGRARTRPGYRKHRFLLVRNHTWC
jgi:hypothetical protein